MILTRLLASVHGHFGVLSTAALLHPAVLLRRGQQLSRGARWAIGLATALAATAFSLGLFIYEDYRSTVKAQLFHLNFQAGQLFETKEHLAYAVVALALGGCVAALTAPKEARELRQVAAATYLAAAVVGALVCILGTYVASVHGFPER